MNSTITQGSKEFFIANLVDQLGAITDLAGTSPVFSVFHGDTKVLIGSANIAATPQGMNVYCLVDTSSGSGQTFPTVPTNGWWLVKAYDLYITLTIGSETPRLGPFTFNVTA